MSVRTSVLLVVPALAAISVGCKKPVEAPTDLGEASIFAFTNFDTEGGEEMQAAVVDTIEPYMMTIEDLNGNSSDRTVSIPQLTNADWGGITGNAEADVDKQVPIAVSGMSAHPVSDHVADIWEPNRVCLESGSTVYAMRTYEPATAGCLADGSCEMLHTEQETRKESLSDVWYMYKKDYRLIELDDGRQMLVGRGWIDETWPTDNGQGSWDQSYTLDIWLEDGNGGTLRYTAMWSSVTLSIISDAMWASLVENGTVEAAEWTEAWLADGVQHEDCKNDRDADFTFPSE